MKATRFAFPLTLLTTSWIHSAVAEPLPEPSALTQPLACVVAGATRAVAHKVRMRAGVEIASTERGIALGFATARNDAVALELDPATAAEHRRIDRHSADRIRRVLPVGGKADLDAAVEADGENTQLEAPITVSAEQPFVVGTVGDKLAWASSMTEGPRALWPLPGGKADELEVIQLAHGRGFGVLVRHDTALWFGALTAEKETAGPLVKVAERSQLRSPTLADADGNVFIFWSEMADRDRWILDGVKVTHDDGIRAVPLSLPASATDRDAMHPFAASVDEHRVLLVWTDVSTNHSDVRGITLDSKGSILGQSLELAPGMDAGWARSAIMADGRGAVVVVAPNEDGLGIAATPISCPSAQLVASAHARF